jgi:CheY-like chemotaxis protein
MQKEPDLKPLPVVVFSNRDNPEDRERAEQLGVDRFYVKAITDLSELVDTLYEITHQ